MVTKQFRGWGAFSETSIQGELREFEYDPKPFEDTDVDIEIMYTGVCGSDLSTMSSGWAAVNYPQVLGHEIVGRAVRVGPAVSHVKEGDIVGVGAQCDSCGSCDDCAAGLENYCGVGWVGTYDGKFNKGNAKGCKSYGGYSNHHRCPGHFVIPIPRSLDPAFAAPMLCGGVTVYQPLKRHGAGTEAKEVGIIGLGGLGHFAILFAVAMGARVTAITHSPSKVEDARKLGASEVIVTHGKGSEEAIAQYRRKLDLLLVCSSKLSAASWVPPYQGLTLLIIARRSRAADDKQLPIDQYLSLLKVGKHMILVAEPEAPLPSFSGFALSANGVYLGGSAVGSPQLIAGMLQFAADNDIKPWIIKRPLKEVNDVIRTFAEKGARYRYVLVNEENGGKL